MADITIPDAVPEDVWRPPSPLALQQEEWRAYGVICVLVLNHLTRHGTTPVSVLAHSVALCSKTYSALRLTEEKRCGILMAAVLTSLEADGLVTIAPSFIRRSPNMKPGPLESLVSTGSKLQTPEGLAFWRALSLPLMACSVGEVTPILSRTLFSENGSPSK